VNGQPIERIVMKKDERRTSNVQHRISNDKKNEIKRSAKNVE